MEIFKLPTVFRPFVATQRPLTRRTKPKLINLALLSVIASTIVPIKADAASLLQLLFGNNYQRATQLSTVNAKLQSQVRPCVSPQNTLSGPIITLRSNRCFLPRNGANDLLVGIVAAGDPVVTGAPAVSKPVAAASKPSVNTSSGGGTIIVPAASHGSHVAFSGTVGFNGTVTVPGGQSVTVGNTQTVGGSVSVTATTAPQTSTGFGDGSALGSASSIGAGSASSDSQGFGSSFTQTVKSGVGAKSSGGSGKSIGAGLGTGAGIGISAGIK